jgi:UDP-2,4-diacetamido-2,4,6-trideoxy-beta-L-altropyranose hydrolase
MQNKVFIRADGNSKIGLGHLVRCMALAQMLKERFTVQFFSFEIQNNFVNELEEQGILFKKINSEEDFFSQLEGDEIVVLDHYELNTNYQKKIKEIGCKLVCIDDLHEKTFLADLIINHAPGISTNSYNAESYTQFALGLEYALLRPAFQNCNETFKTRLNNSIFICFGGSDPKNLTKRSLEVIMENFSFQLVTVVVGETYSNYSNLEDYANNFPNVKLYKGVDEYEMVNLMQKSESAIVPASGILLEALACGMQLISGMYVDNQRNFYNNYKEAGLFIDAANFSVANIKRAILDSKLNKMSQKVQINTSTKTKILKLFSNLIKEDFIHFRSALKNDVNITYKWAQDPNIRSFSFSKSLIHFEDHQLWYFNKLESINCYYLIAEYNEKAVGSIRFDIIEDRAVISYLVDTEYQGNGFGIVLLKQGVELLQKKYSNVNEVVGYVLLRNIASVKAFEKLGYKKTVRNDEFIFTKKINN